VFEGKRSGMRHILQIGDNCTDSDARFLRFIRPGKPGFITVEMTKNIRVRRPCGRDDKGLATDGVPPVEMTRRHATDGVTVVGTTKAERLTVWLQSRRQEVAACRADTVGLPGFCR